MGTISAEQQALRAPLSCHEILRIAQQDGQGVYGDLSGYTITLAQKADGWHVDYEPSEPLIAGGGPHYVIDPNNGSILSKRYEQ
jgi:hypothetical protein